MRPVKMVNYAMPSAPEAFRNFSPPTLTPPRHLSFLVECCEALQHIPEQFRSADWGLGPGEWQFHTPLSSTGDILIHPTASLLLSMGSAGTEKER